MSEQMRTLPCGLGPHHFLNSSFHFLTCARLRNERDLKKTKKTTEPRRDNRGNRRKKGEKRGNCNERDQYKREMWEGMEVLGGKFWDFFLPQQWLHFNYKDCQIHPGDGSTHSDLSFYS